MGMSELHVEPHLMIVDVAARHERHPLSRSYAFEYPTGRNHQKRPGKGGIATCCSGSGLRPTPHQQVAILILIDAALSS